ncbi:MAG TPA: N-acyl homoserine lactonase family protein [Solirubrobacterales bacterium]|jgi:glyoxylase-like metal-dependent hydrolase (beta-lactamase superfamily II)|nr:N-acyl homoserine lactonase family protein [Solirubrobacterales bacterium]
MLNGGWMTASAALWRQGDDPEKRIRFPVPAYVVETETERILIDTGLHPGACAGASTFYDRPEAMGLFSFELDQPVQEQIDTTTITKIVLTHLHWDHAGGLSLLPSNIPLVVQRREWEAGNDPGAIERNFFFPRDYIDDEREVVLVDGDHDLLGDGSIELLLTPGHTPGHQSVRIGDGLILGIDVAYFASGLDDHRFPVFADDHAEQRRSAERLRALRDSGARVIPGHDPDVLRPGTALAT